MLFYFDTKGSVAEHSIPSPVFAVRAFESGFYPVQTARSASYLNDAQLGTDVLEAALAGSMFGWTVPAARAAVNFLRARGVEA